MTPTDFRSHVIAQFVWDTTGFSFDGQPVSHLIFFGVGAVLFATSVVAAALALTDKQARLRWLWALGSLIGFGKAALLWKAGGGDFYPISLQVPILMLRGTTTRDFVLEFGIPVVALTYLVLRMGRAPIAPIEKPSV